MKQKYAQPMVETVTVAPLVHLNAGSAGITSDGTKVDTNGSHGYGNAANAASRGRGGWTDDDE